MARKVNPPISAINPGKPPDMKAYGWRCTKKLGDGGQGSVWKAARTEADGKSYVLKLLKPNSDEKAKARFTREIDAIKKLNHPGLIPIVAACKATDHDQYYVMEFIDGLRPLAEFFGRKSPFADDPIKSLDAYIELLDILKHCHEQQVIHRDISARNVMVTEDNCIRLIDFGLCMLGDGPLTSTAEGIGTYGYRPPELLNYAEDKATPASDLYSAGKILWSLLANKIAADREVKFFGQLSYFKHFPHLPLAWHLQHISNKTIRHDVPQRHHDAAEAINWAWNVRKLILSGFMPLEALTSRTCPFCGLGQVGSKDDAHQGRIVEALKDTNYQFLHYSHFCDYCYRASFSLDALVAQDLAKISKYS